MGRSTPHDPFAFLLGGGEMGERIRAFDWASTPLGPVEHWSQALRTTLRMVLADRLPHLLWWGPEYIQLYNDAYAQIPGAKHPDRALGRPASQCWAEIWHVIGGLIDRAFPRRSATTPDATGITAYLDNGSPENAQAMAAHEKPSNYQAL
jgi:hypothetical protein